MTDSRNIIDALGGYNNKAASQTQLLWSHLQKWRKTCVKDKRVRIQSHRELYYDDHADKLATAAKRSPFLEHNQAIVPYEVMKSLLKTKTGSRLPFLDNRTEDIKRVTARQTEAVLYQLRGE